jgi:hypothetical protein
LKVADERDYQSLAAVGVTPEYVRGMRAAGVSLDARSAQSLCALGITPKFVKKLADAGYPHLSVADLQRLAASGLNGDFVREMSKYRGD